jgi:mono/diheme cytochrome c family protein
MFLTPLRSALLALSIVAPAAAKLSPQQLAQLPAPAARPVDFAKDIQPIFEASCVQCHGRGKAKGAFSLETRADFLAGGDAGSPVVPGKSAESLVVEMISGLNPENVMPQKGKKLSREQVAVFRAWIDQGLPWPESINFFRHEPANLRPRENIALPVAKPDLDHPVDRLIDGYFAQHKIAWKAPVDDRVYARRVYLDTIGLLPTPAELDAFVTDRAPDKRAALVQKLLADNQRYAEHWLTFWNDLLRNDYKGAGYIDGGRKPITRWLYGALARNLPYDQFAAQLLNPGAEAEGFANGILWRGAVNASMVPPMQAAQSIAQVFLGVNLKCASCHDSFINEYTLADAYGLAAIYSDEPLEIAECDKPTGHTAKVKMLYDDLGAIDAQGAPERRKQQLAEIITGRKNGRLPRTIVNRLWQRFMGYGLVEPVDEMDKPAWAPDVLDWLAEDLVANGYNLKHTIARILTSRAYQLPTVNVRETEEHFVFTGPGIRRLSAEQFSDAIMAVTQQVHAKPDARMNRIAALQRPTEPLPLQPKWIWGARDAHVKAKPASFTFRRTVTLASVPTEANFAIVADDNYSIKINGKNAGSSGRRNSTGIDWLDVREHFRAGENTVEITALNMPPDEGRLVSVKEGETLNPDSPAGLILYARLRTADTAMDFVTDRSWSVTAGRTPTGAVIGTPQEVAPTDLGDAIELGGVDLAPWKVGQAFLDIAAAPADKLPVRRASLVGADPLMTALGRPNREQVTTVRQTTPTTLQALELTNGATLAKLLADGAKKVIAAAPQASSAELIDTLYRQTLSRPPTEKERALALEIVGTPAQAAGVEDLLWALAMLPEFQLIY